MIYFSKELIQLYNIEYSDDDYLFIIPSDSDINLLF